MEHLHMAIEGFGAKHEDLVKNPRFSLMSRLNPRFVFKPDKFVGFRCSGYILYILCVWTQCSVCCAAHVYIGVVF